MPLWTHPVFCPYEHLYHLERHKGCWFRSCYSPLTLTAFPQTGPDSCPSVYIPGLCGQTSCGMAGGGDGIAGQSWAPTTSPACTLWLPTLAQVPVPNSHSLPDWNAYRGLFPPSRWDFWALPCLWFPLPITSFPVLASLSQAICAGGVGCWGCSASTFQLTHLQGGLPSAWTTNPPGSHHLFSQ